MPAAFPTIQSNTSTAISATISCQPSLRNGTGFLLIFILPCNNRKKEKEKRKKKKKHTIFSDHKMRDRNFMSDILKYFFSNCNIQKPISNVSQDWYLQLSTQNSFKIELTTD